MATASSGRNIPDRAAGGQAPRHLADVLPLALQALAERPDNLQPPVRHRIGDVIQQRGRYAIHAYRLIAADPYTRRDGKASVVLTWGGTCWRCGAAFTATSGRKPRYLTRTCKSHRLTREAPHA